MHHDRPESSVFTMCSYSGMLYLIPLPPAADAKSTPTYNLMRIQLEIPSLQWSIITKDILLCGEVLFYLPRIDTIAKIFPNFNV